MSCLISFERCLSSCEERGTSEHYKKILSTVGFEPPNTAPFVFQHVPLNHSATETVDDLRLELLQYLFTLRYNKNSVPCAKRYTENENKIIAYLQFGDRYHLNTRWLTQKKKFIMSYMSMTTYNIYSFFIYYCLYCMYHNLFLYIISLLQSRELNRTNYFNQYRCYRTCDNASMKLIMIWFVRSTFCKQK